VRNEKKCVPLDGLSSTKATSTTLIALNMKTLHLTKFECEIFPSNVKMQKKLCRASKAEKKVEYHDFFCW
jgi:hypothetical protein